MKFPSPLPFVDLQNPTTISRGLYADVPSFCREKLSSQICQAHYKRMQATANTSHEPFVLQCPYGFASVSSNIEQGDSHAFTCIVPFPRIGGDKERQRAKAFPECKISIDRVLSLLRAYTLGKKQLGDIERASMSKQASALHEARKYNRTIKQTAERTCREQNPRDPDSANAELVKIWKASELLSNQFQIIELLANEDLARLPLATESNLYRLFDKCIRIYKDEARRRELSINVLGGDLLCRACDKTLPIVATTLIENATKYALKGSTVEVEFRRLPENWGLVLVRNFGPSPKHPPELLFGKGVRGTTDGDGDGVGLYLARLVAEQHGARLWLDALAAAQGTSVFQFNFRIPVLA